MFTPARPRPGGAVVLPPVRSHSPGSAVRGPPRIQGLCRRASSPSSLRSPWSRPEHWALALPVAYQTQRAETGTDSAGPSFGRPAVCGTDGGSHPSGPSHGPTREGRTRGRLCNRVPAPCRDAGRGCDGVPCGARRRAEVGGRRSGRTRGDHLRSRPTPPPRGQRPGLRGDRPPPFLRTCTTALAPECSDAPGMTSERWAGHPLGIGDLGAAHGRAGKGQRPRRLPVGGDADSELVCALCSGRRRQGPAP